MISASLFTIRYSLFVIPPRLGWPLDLDLPKTKKEIVLISPSLFTIRYSLFDIPRGPDQIRTGVGAFAELSLATRPQDHCIFSLSDFAPTDFGIRFVHGSNDSFGEN